jgi:hypothetical protein
MAGVWAQADVRIWRSSRPSNWTKEEIECDVSARRVIMEKGVGCVRQSGYSIDEVVNKRTMEIALDTWIVSSTGAADCVSVEAAPDGAALFYCTVGAPKRRLSGAVLAEAPHLAFAVIGREIGP